MSDEKVPKLDIVGAIDDIFRSTGQGDRSVIHGDYVYGFDTISKGKMIQPSRTTTGMVFFSRPMLNLTYDNLSREIQLMPWRDGDPDSYLGMTRAQLDPLSETMSFMRVKTRGNDGKDYYGGKETFRSALSDPLNPFLVVLSNSLVSLSGWPDPRLDYYASDKGIRGEQWFKMDGTTEINYVYDLSATFNNGKGDPVYMMLKLWTEYIYRVGVGDLWPYPQMIARQMIDYMTRIYSFTFEETKTFITHWADCGAAAPGGIQTGAVHNYDSQEVHKTAMDTVSVSFQAVGARYNNLATLHSFNKLVAMFNPDLQVFPTRTRNQYKMITDDGSSNIPWGNKGSNDHDQARWIKLTLSERQVLNMKRVYPLINMVTKEMEWWCHISDYMLYVNRGVNKVSPSRGRPIAKATKQAYIPGIVGNERLTKEEMEAQRTAVKPTFKEIDLKDSNAKFQGGSTGGGGASGKW